MGGMNGRSIRGAAMVFLAALALAACDQLPMMAAVAEAVRSGADPVAPVPGGGGALTAFAPALSGFSLSWTAATDNVSPSTVLSYKVVCSTADNITSVAEAETVGGGRSVALDWTPNVTSKMITGLTASTRYYVVVLVKDGMGNKAVYTKRDGPPVMEVSLGTIIAAGSVVDFGVIYTGFPANRTFSLANRGFGLLDLTNPGPNYVTVSNSNAHNEIIFTVPTQPVDAIPPGTTRTFTIQAATAAYSEQKNGNVSIPTNWPDSPAFSFGVTVLAS